MQEFIKEVSEAFRLTDTSNEAWDLIDAIIHEWHESAVAITSPDLAAAVYYAGKHPKNAPVP
ncbi:hypothetical protein [Dolichospermum compactum]|uniref:Uncharacterized protein n=1 Tax=Dolichospermum compactum NIES-806 TaxID=1973481 RepID=A0A1Z4UZS1_9CYAN|nr:hypothetical protein [Dolichospermum compactum]BAZ84772.1 hypothetical protein NIES806_09640 [Dolichospermum compactum NIES-806]